MKTATALLRSTESLGIVLWVEAGQIRYKAKQPVSDGWKSQIRAHKAEIINLLATDKPGGATEAARPTVSSWCNVRCEHYHKLSIPDRGTMAWCCWEDDSTHWRRVRVDSMTKCPLKGEI